MENESSSAIYGAAGAPYINNTLVPMAAKATMFMDELAAALPSEPHYEWMEAGTNTFSDVTFITDADASIGNSTSSTAHLVTQLRAANIAWMSYQEGIAAGTCPIASITSANYAAKHDPFVFFQDVSGNPPSLSSSYCAAHHKPYSAFAADLATGMLPPLRVHHAEPVPRHAWCERLSVGHRRRREHHGRRYLAIDGATTNPCVRRGSRFDRLRHLGRGQLEPDHPCSSHWVPT